MFGGRKETAAVFGVSSEAVRIWLRDGFPLERALDAEEKTQGFVKGEDVLREARTRRDEARRVLARAAVQAGAST